MPDLTELHCQPSRDPGDRLTSRQIAELLPAIHSDWHYTTEQHTISRSFKFRDYLQTMNFANAVAWIAQQEDHHPELHISYHQCVIFYTTHSVHGLSINDFICAAHIDALLE